MSDQVVRHPTGVTVLAIDPGRSKCGLAVVTGNGEPASAQALRAIVIETQSLIVEMADVLRKFPQVSTIILGNGTQSRILRRAIQEMFPDLPLVLVEEHGTSLLARAQYLDEHPPRGWRRLLPAGLRTPDRPIDDVVAVILAREYLLNLQKYLQQ